MEIYIERKTDRMGGSYEYIFTIVIRIYETEKKYRPTVLPSIAATTGEICIKSSTANAIRRAKNLSKKWPDICI